MAEVVEPDLQQPAAPVAAVPAPEPPVVEPAADPDEADAVDLPAGKHVPLPALKAVRNENKALKEQLAAMTPAAQWAAANKAKVDFIDQNPQLFAPRPPAPPTPTGADPELVELARALDYYKADGTPDLERAARTSALLDSKAEKKARAMVEPVAGTMLQQQQTANWQSATAEKLPNGQPINQSLLADAWRAVAAYPNGANILADPRAVRVIVNTVKMQQLESGSLPPTPPAPPGKPPIVTEPVGSAPARKSATMNDVERSIIGTRMDDKKFHEHTKDFRPGRPNVLEDD